MLTSKDEVSSKSNVKLLPIRHLNQRYHILKHLGDGSFGQVFLAIPQAQSKEEVPGIDRKPLVAIKTIKKRVQSIIEYSYFRECQFLFKVPAHDNLIKTYEIFVDGDMFQCEIVMEYMEMNLYQLAKTRKKSPFTLNTFKQILLQIVKGMAHLHHNSFFHRDIKPENILVTIQNSSPKTNEDCEVVENNSTLTASNNDNCTYIVKIADFGLARHCDCKDPYTSYVSTRWYRSPELLLRLPKYSFGVDIWAFGAMAVELANLRPLFPGTNEIDQISRHIRILGTPTSQGACGSWDSFFSAMSALGLVFEKVICS